MFQLEQAHSAWNHGPRAKGKQDPDVKVGLWIIEVVSTGKLITGTSPTVTKAVFKEIALLQAGKHPCKALQRLYESDPEVRVYEVPTKSDRSAKVQERAIRKSTHPQYLLLM